MSAEERAGGPFWIDRSLYEKDLKSSYVERFEPRTLIQFAVLLPFRVPARGLYVTLFPERDIAHTFLFHEIQVLEEIPEGVLGGDVLKLPQEKTRVEMAYVTAEELCWDDAKEEEGVHLMQEVFNTLVAGLNVVLTGYMLATQHIAAHRVTAEMIGPLYFGRFVPLDRWEEARVGGYLVHKEPLAPGREELTSAELERWKDYCNEMSQGENPFLVVRQIALTADRHLRDGSYSEAVVFAQTGVEVFLWSVYAALCSAEGKNAPPDVSFKALVKTEMPPRLGGNWSLTDNRFPAAKWYQQTYDLRNRIVHGGRFATKEQAAEALSAADEFYEWVVSRIEGRRKKYPRLASLVSY